jgi:hypothetical protein
MPRGDESSAGTGELKIKEGSPWVKDGSSWVVDSCIPRWKLDLNDKVIIASRGDTSLVAVRNFSGPDAEKKVQTLWRIKHDKFIALLGCFCSENSLYAIFEHDISKEETIVVTLSQFALSDPYIDEFQLAKILGQVGPLPRWPALI